MDYKQEAELEAQLEAQLIRAIYNIVDAVIDADDVTKALITDEICTEVNTVLKAHNFSESG